MEDEIKEKRIWKNVIEKQERYFIDDVILSKVEFL